MSIVVCCQKDRVYLLNVKYKNRKYIWSIYTYQMPSLSDRQTCPQKTKRQGLLYITCNQQPILGLLTYKQLLLVLQTNQTSSNDLPCFGDYQDDFVAFCFRLFSIVNMSTILAVDLKVLSSIDCLLNRVVSSCNVNGILSTDCIRLLSMLNSASPTI